MGGSSAADDPSPGRRPAGAAAGLLGVIFLCLLLLSCGGGSGGAAVAGGNEPSDNSQIVVNALGDTASPPAGTETLRSALARLESGGTITFHPALSGQTITLSIVGEEHSLLKGEFYSPTMTFMGYQDRDYGRSALYAAKHLTLDASALPGGITIAWGGGDANRARVLAVYGNLTMKNVTVTGGYASAEAIVGGSQPYTLARGGGLAVWGTVKLENCVLSGNRCLGDNGSSRDRGTYGGAIYANAVNLKDCIISGNSAAGYGAAGGAIYSVGGADRVGGIGLDSSLTRCTVSGNRVTAQHAYGGGIFSLAGGPNNLAWLRLTNCTIARNLVEDNPALPDAGQYYYRGGGVYMGGGSLALVSSTVVQNEVNGIAAIFSGKPNMGGGGIAATIGNAHVVENAFVHHSIVAGNKLSGADEDWFTGSLLNFTSLGYNRFGVLDFSQILVPVPDWTDLSRKHYPKVGDQDGVAAGAVLDMGNIRFHGTVLSAGPDAGPGQLAVLWYPPAGSAVDQIPAGSYDIVTAVAGYSGFGLATDDFLNGVVAKLRTDYPVLGAGFGAGLGDMTGVTWNGPAVTWPSNAQNAAWIAAWRNIDAEIGGRLGMVKLGDDFWASFADGPFGNVAMDISTQDYAAALESFDQLGNVRPAGPLGDIGAVEAP